MINERLARQRFGTENPIGRFAHVGAAALASFEIVGVVADDHHVAVDADPTPTFFLPYRHTPSPREIAVIARGEGDTAQILGAVRSAIRALDPEMPFYRVQTMEQIVDASVATPRSLAWLLSSFALSGLLLAVIAVFGVLSHAVTQRTQEIGVRIAIGATPAQVLRLVLGEGLVQVGLGMTVGIAIALGMARLLSGLPCLGGSGLRRGLCCLLTSLMLPSIVSRSSARDDTRDTPVGRRPSGPPHDLDSPSATSCQLMA